VSTKEDRVPPRAHRTTGDSRACARTG
jgi:hypothetical protein